MAINTLTNANMRSLVQKLVRDSSTTSPGLASADYTDLLNDAMFAYVGLYPDDPGISGYIGSALASLGVAYTASITPFVATAVVRNVTAVTTSSLKPISLKPIGDILRQQSADATTGVPTECAFFTNGAPNPVVAGTSFDRVLFLWRIPSANDTLSVFGQVEPTPLSADGDYTPFGQAACREIARMAAIDAARMLGRPAEFVAALGQSLPDRLAEHKSVIKRALSPRYYEGKAVG